jgi:hypothetical protein
MSLLIDKTGHFVRIQPNREAEFSSLIDSYIERTALLADEMNE